MLLERDDFKKEKVETIEEQEQREFEEQVRKEREIGVKDEDMVRVENLPMGVPVITIARNGNLFLAKYLKNGVKKYCLGAIHNIDGEEWTIYHYCGNYTHIMAEFKLFNPDGVFTPFMKAIKKDWEKE